MLSCWEAGQPTSALQAAVQHHSERTQDRQAWSAKRPFPSRIFLSSLAALWACESNSATRPVPGILSRWWWTGGWTGRLGREWWLVPDYTSGGWVPLLLLHLLLLLLLPSYARHGRRDRMLSSLCSSEVLSCLLVTWHDAVVVQVIAIQT